MLVNLEKINKFYNGFHILKNVNLTIENSDRIGLVGINGCGKSTLLRLITGKELPDKIVSDEGNIAVSNGVSMGFLEQNGGLNRENSIYSEMKLAFSELLNVAEKMSNLEKFMACDESHISIKYNETAAEYSRLASFFEANEGYEIDIKIKTILTGMGFLPNLYETKISTLSGGEKTRLALAKLLLENPNLLILDEPTNHLDFKTFNWLEGYLQGYRGALLVVSHDRYFLNKLATSICEIENGKLSRYNGNYTSFVTQKEMATIRQAKEYEMQQVQISHLQEYVDKNIARASTAQSAKSRRNILDKMELIEKPVVPSKTAKLRFESDIVPPKDILTVAEIDLTVGKNDNTKLLINSLSFEIKRGDKVAVIGDNGIGKSSLLKVIQGKLPHSKGSVDWAKNVKIGYFDQENSQLNPFNTCIDELHNRFRFLTDLEIRTVLGRVRLIGENVYKTINVISGGERAKLCFAILMLERANVLILDEPTNHLDLATKEVLEEALAAFEGTIIFVSHDRYLIERIATRILDICHNGVTAYNCNFNTYIEIAKENELAELAKSAEKKLNVSEKQTKNYRTKEQRSLDAGKKLRTRELEVKIDNLQLEINELQDELTHPEVFSNYQIMSEKCLKVEELKEEMSQNMEEWLLLCEDT